ncbi:hypothetical protein CSPAE12_01806 [Colletotrichum incanum]|nr:hypothetical protein CSPAE12_01806 [Colletotrichum incanum]
MGIVCTKQHTTRQPSYQPCGVICEGSSREISPSVISRSYLTAKMPNLLNWSVPRLGWALEQPISK